MATWTVYNSWRTAQFDGSKTNTPIDFDTDTIKIALASTAYTPAQATHDYFNDITEVSAGGNYSAGGLTLSSITTSGTTTVTIGDPTTNVLWSQDASNPTNARYAILYKDSAGTAAADPLIAYADIGTVDMTGGDLELQLGTADNGDIFSVTFS